MTVRAARIAKGWKAARLASLIGVSKTTLSQWENGHQRPHRRRWEQLCRVLGRDPVDLGFEEDLLEVDRREFMHKLIGALGAATVAPLVGGVGAESLERIASSRHNTAARERTAATTAPAARRDRWRDRRARGSAVLRPR